MQLPPFLLDQWLAQHQFASPPIAHDLAASTGPKWTLAELLALGEDGPDLGALEIGYAPSDGSRRLREAIAAHHGVEADWVLATTGASEAFSILACLAARPGASIVLSSPGFSAFEAVAGAWGLAVRPCRLEREDGFRQSADGVLAAVDDSTTLVLVNTPHNPTGSVMPRDEIERLAGALSERGVPLVVDEVYHPLSFGESSPSAAGLVNVIVIGDMSKALSLPGLRTGWIIDRDPVRRAAALDARSYFTISGSPILEALAAHALAHRQPILDRLVRTVTANRMALSRTLAAHAERIGLVEAAGGTVCFPWFRDGRDARPTCVALAEKGVLVAPGDCFGRPGHMRIGLGAPTASFLAALAVVDEVLKST